MVTSRRLLYFLLLLLWLQNLSDGSGKYDRLIKSASDRYFGLESDYLWHKARIRVESNFNVLAESNVGAAGLSQFMPNTAIEFGAKTLEDRLDPVWSIDAMTRYIRKIWTMLPDTTAISDRQMLSDAGYNGGPNRVKRLCKTYGYTWQSVNGVLPSETRKYSPLIQLWRTRYAQGLSR